MAVNPVIPGFHPDPLLLGVCPRGVTGTDGWIIRSPLHE